MRRTVWSGDLETVVPEISAETQTAFALDDRDPWAHFAPGILLLRLHRFGEAVRALRRALELNPNFALAHALLADALALQGVHQEAVDSAEHALRLSPRDRLVGTSASLAMAQVNFGGGRYPECVTWARSMIERSPGHTGCGAGAGGGSDRSGGGEGARCSASGRNSRWPVWLRTCRPSGRWPSGFVRPCARLGCRRHDCNPPSHRDPCRRCEGSLSGERYRRPAKS